MEDSYGDDKTIEIGTPTIAGAKIEADLIKIVKINYLNI